MSPKVSNTKLVNKVSVKPLTNKTQRNIFNLNISANTESFFTQLLKCNIVQVLANFNLV